MAETTPQPEFMMGTFDWSAFGFFYPEEGAPAEVLAAQALYNSNPWVVAAAVAERAKRGDHSHVPLLRRYYEGTYLDVLPYAALALTGDMGREQDLPLIEAALGSSNSETRCNAATAAALAGRLWLVPSMLAAWENAEGAQEHAMIGYSIAELLEDRGGELAAKADIYTIRNVEAFLANNPLLERAAPQLRILASREPEFIGLVKKRYQLVSRLIPEERTFVWHGAAWSMDKFVSEFLAALREEIPRPFVKLRHRFEAYTGIDCSEAFVDGEPDALEMTAILEDFVESGEMSKFVDGQRYFFGHPVPA
ncbi:hypothetical protein [Mesorhizobium sp. M0091]|uniref:hypothetical protein n=1 Tax=Mesorhizobium sp. M0091 TaxID=2956875 RepID=UPI003339417F